MPTKMNLYELAFACYLYDGFTDFDKSYNSFLKATNNSPDLTNADHRKALLIWLNQWGCRQFALEYHELASNEILTWYLECNYLLPPKEKYLWELAETEIEKIDQAFNSLSNKIASRKIRNGKDTQPRVGLTGAAKILFAVRPNSLVPWDDPIRVRHKKETKQNSYRSYLKRVKSELLKLEAECRKNGFSLVDLPKMIGRPNSTAPVLIDEYYWVTITRKCKSPDLDTLKKWVIWAER